MVNSVCVYGASRIMCSNLSHRDMWTLVTGQCGDVPDFEQLLIFTFRINLFRCDKQNKAACFWPRI